jgi:hypothetical protein
MAKEPWYNSTAMQLTSPGTPSAAALSGVAGDDFWSGVGDYFVKWDPILIGPIIEGLRAEDEAKRREEELGPSPTFNIPEGYDFALKQLRKRQNQQMPGYGANMAGIEQAAAANATVADWQERGCLYEVCWATGPDGRGRHDGCCRNELSNNIK